MANWLLKHTKTLGVWKTPAKLRPSWKSPSEVAPSPNVTTTAARTLRRFRAMAAPTAWGIWEPTGIEIGNMFTPSGAFMPASLPIQKW